SDFLSKAHFLAGLAFLFLPGVMLVVGAAAMVHRRKALQIAAAFPLALLLAGLAVAGSEWAFGRIETFRLYVLLMTAAILLGALLIWLLPSRAAILDRTAQISRIILYVAAPFTATAWLVHHVVDGARSQIPPRHVVMIVVD